MIAIESSVILSSYDVLSRKPVSLDLKKPRSNAAKFNFSFIYIARFSTVTYIMFTNVMFNNRKNFSFYFYMFFLGEI